MRLNTPSSIWAYLVHLGYNMWADRDAPERKPTLEECRERHMQAIELVGQARAALS